jgi:succinate-acetate transporter protein
MNDMLFLGLTILFLLLSIGLIHTLDGLREDKS